MSDELKKYSAAVLCGGQSRRMGFDKSLALRDREGRLLLAALAEELGRRFGQVLLITNSRAKFAGIAELAPFRLEEDLHPLAGPTGAVHTALTMMPTPLFVMACDMPLIDWPIIEDLAALIAAGRHDAAVPRHDRKIEPLYAFYSLRAENILREALDRQRLAIRDAIILKMNTVYLDLTSNEEAAKVFKNFNTTDDVRREGLSLPPEVEEGNEHGN